MKRFLTIDIRSSSVKHIVDWLDGVNIVTYKVHRFQNRIDDVNDCKLKAPVFGCFSKLLLIINSAKTMLLHLSPK